MNPLWRRLAEKALLPAGKWLVAQVGLDWVLKMVERAVEGIGHRQKAILKARSIRDGRFGSSIIEDRTRWVVYSDDEPRAAFPSIEGDLAEELRGYDRTRLRRPDELNTARARAWAASRFQTLRDRLRRGEEPDVADDGRTAIERASRSSESTGRDRGEGGLAKLEEQVGNRVFSAIVERMPTLLDELSACPARPAAEHPAVPAAPGVYLFSEGPTPLYIGNTRSLRRRLRQDTGATAHENEAAFAWRLALKEAGAAGVATTGTREEVEADPALAELLRRARDRIARMDVRFIEIDDAITRTVFEVYAAQALGTDEFNSFETN